MIEALAGLLVATLVGLPLATALTATTAILAGIATILALTGLFTRSAALLTAAVMLGLGEELAAVMQAGTPTDVLTPVLLGIVIYSRMPRILARNQAVLTNYFTIMHDATVKITCDDPG